MIVRTALENCLYLNWALPRAMLPDPPGALRYDVRDWQGGEAVFASALFFRQATPRFRFIPLPRVSYPQFQLQLCTLDSDGTPSVLIRSLLLPAWVTPGARWLAGQPARTAELSYPRSIETVAGPAEWRIARHGSLAVEAEPGSPMVGGGPALGPWERTVSYFCRRPVAYAMGTRGLHRIEIETEPGTVLPMKAVLREDRLLHECLGSGEREWPSLHSAWLCPPMIASLVVGEAATQPVGARIPAPG
jgi:hypothetical protein